MIITISRQLGSGGSAIARDVGAALGWRVVDNELVDRIAARAEMTRDEVSRLEERAPGFFERLLRNLTMSAPEIMPPPPEKVPEVEEAHLVRITEAVVEDVARGGRVVLVGRAAPAVLSGERDALHAKIVAPRDVRVAAVMERLGLDAERAAVAVDQSDANRSRYHRQYYHRDWNDSSRYDLVLNSHALGVEQTVATIVGRAKTRWPDETLERRTT